MQQDKLAYSPRRTTGFFCPFCGRAVMPKQRASYPPEAVGQFAPVYRCGCGKAIGEPVSMLAVRKPST
jgi:hypothetical protein